VGRIHLSASFPSTAAEREKEKEKERKREREKERVNTVPNHV